MRIAEQFGIVYLLLNVAQDQKLVEKHGKAAGVDIKVDYVKLSGGSAVNDALLSGNIDIAGAGVGPLLTIWDRTYGKQNVRGVASLGNFPYYLVSNNPAVKTIADSARRTASRCRPWACRCSRACCSSLRPSCGATRSTRSSTSCRWRCRTPRRGRHHQGRHRDHGALRQPAVPGAGAGRQPQGRTSC
jgi:hypothetical protein